MSSGSTDHVSPAAMSVHVCTATNGTSRKQASAKANSTAASDTADPSTPTTTGPASGVASSSVRPRMTTTGQCPCAATPQDTEPTSIPANPPSPREPSTSSSAVFDSSISCAAGKPTFSSVCASTSCASSAASRNTWCPASVWSGQTWHNRTGTRRRAASAAAQRTACRDDTEPSTPTRIVMVASSPAAHGDPHGLRSPAVRPLAPFWS